MAQEEKESEATRQELDQEMFFSIRNPRIRQAFLAVDRKLFIPKELASDAYVDTAIGNGENSSVSQPTLVGEMVDGLRLNGTERVLDVGTGSGYQANVMALCAGEIYTIDISQELCEQAIKRFEESKTTNIFTFVRDGANGLPEFAPFDRIIVSAHLFQVPQALTDQLAEGGVIIAPVGKDPNVPRLVIGLKNGGEMVYRTMTKKVWFLKLMSGVEGGWTTELVQKYKEAKRAILRNEIEKKWGPEGLTEFYKELRDHLQSRGINVPDSDDELMDLFGEQEQIPDKMFDEYFAPPKEEEPTEPPSH